MKREYTHYNARRNVWEDADGYTKEDRASFAKHAARVDREMQAQAYKDIRALNKRIEDLEELLGASELRKKVKIAELEKQLEELKKGG